MLEVGRAEVGPSQASGSRASKWGTAVISDQASRLILCISFLTLPFGKKVRINNILEFSILSTSRFQENLWYVWCVSFLTQRFPLLTPWQNWTEIWFRNITRKLVLIRVEPSRPFVSCEKSCYIKKMNAPKSKPVHQQVECTPATIRPLHRLDTCQLFHPFHVHRVTDVSPLNILILFDVSTKEAWINWGKGITWCTHSRSAPHLPIRRHRSRHSIQQSQVICKNGKTK